MIRAVWSAFWGELTAPSAFPDDPYGALANQVGHIALGAFAAAAVSLAYCMASGEMPFRWMVWAGVTAVYLVSVEWLKEGWTGADGLIDTAFVSLGAAVPLASLKEVAFVPHVILEPQPEQGLGLLAVIVLALVAYVYPRALRKWRANGGQDR